MSRVDGPRTEITPLYSHSTMTQQYEVVYQIQLLQPFNSQNRGHRQKCGALFKITVKSNQSLEGFDNLKHRLEFLNILLSGDRDQSFFKKLALSVLLMNQCQFECRISLTYIDSDHYNSGQIKFKMPGVISIQGNLGAGKSTLLSLLNFSVIRQPVEEWSNTAGSNVLERYYSEPKRWAFTFQLNALHSRSKLWHKTLEMEPKKQHFSERSPMADRYIFGQIMKSQGNMDASEYAIYDSLCETLMQNCPLEAIIYLRCDPSICHERIKKRNRQGQQCIPLNYLQKVHDRHQEWLSRQKNIKLLTIDTGAFDVENPEDVGQLVKLIQNFVDQIQ